MKKIILYILLFGFLVHCKSIQENSVFENSAKIIPQNNILKLSSIFNDYKLIQLSGIAFTNIQKVEIIDSLIIVKGVSAEAELHVFTLSGQHVYPVIKKGRGADETLNIQDFIIDREQKNIEILCDYGRKIVVHSLEEKKNIKEIQICPEIYSAQNLQKIDSQRYVLYKQCGFTSDNEYKINIFNGETRRLENHFLQINKKASEYISFSQYNNLYKKDGEIYFYETFVDTVYRCTPGHIQPAWIFDKQQYAFPRKLLYKGYQEVGEFIETCKNSSYIWGHINVFEYDRFFISIFNQDNKLYLNVTDKVKKSSTSYTEFLDDLIWDEKLTLTQLVQIGCDSNYCFFYIEPFDVLELIDNKKQDNTYNDYKNRFPIPAQFIENINMESNSILILLQNKKDTNEK